MTDVLVRFSDANPVLQHQLDPSIEAMWSAIDQAAQRTERHGPRRVLLTVPPAVGVLVAVVLAVMLVGGTGGGGLVSAQASAAQVLRSAAIAIAATPVRLPGPRQFFFVEWRSTFLEPIRANVKVPLTPAESLAPKARVTVETWDAWSATRVGETETRVLNVTFPTRAARKRWEVLGRPNLQPVIGGEVKIAPQAQINLYGNASLTFGQLVELPTNPHALYERLFAHSNAAQALDEVDHSLDLYPVSSTLRAAIYRALALVPGIHHGGRTRTLTGKIGDALWAPTGPPPAANRTEVIIDPRTGAILGSQIVITDPRSEDLPVGTIYAQTAVVETAVTNTPQPPAG